jgi:lipopolysaccharide/colanic/teichoic acid biosynthesis glycosyltransferase
MRPLSIPRAADIVPAVSQSKINSRYRRIGKRCLDLAITLPALLLLSPALILLALLVRLQLGAPVLFRQERVGQGDRVFRLLKFRTMTNARDAEGRLLPDSDRLTSFGLFMRSWSLDELPQLFNVLRGDLSLVGPRPLLVRYLPRYSERQRRRHAIRSGLTGWAQVNGGNMLSWEERFECDLWYVESCSLGLDLQILMLTLKRLLDREQRRGAASDPLPEFWGEMQAPLGAPLAPPADEIERRDPI